MNWDTYLEALRVDSDLLISAAKKGLDAPVPACPGWTVRDVVSHTGQIHRTKAVIVRDGLLERLSDVEMPLPPAAELIDWFAEGARLLLDTLESADPTKTVWTWHSTEQTVGFWYRRMAHETLIHRVDAEQAHGQVSPADPDLFADGIDEFLSVIMEGASEGAETEQGEAIIEISVPGRSWFCRRDFFSGTSMSGRALEREPFYNRIDGEPEAACRVHGSPQAMNLWLWGRGNVGDLDVSGDARIAGELRAAAAAAAR